MSLQQSIIALILPLSLGLVVILQGGMNKKISLQLGLLQTTVINGLIFFVASIVIWLVIGFHDKAPELLKHKGHFTNLKWWEYTPGLLGCFLVLGVPYSIVKIGALKTVVGMIFAQIIFGLLWDRIIENIDINPHKILGLIIFSIGFLYIVLKG